MLLWMLVFKRMVVACLYLWKVNNFSSIYYMLACKAYFYTVVNQFMQHEKLICFPEKSEGFWHALCICLSTVNEIVAFMLTRQPCCFSHRPKNDYYRTSVYSLMWFKISCYFKCRKVLWTWERHYSCVFNIMLHEMILMFVYLHP